MQVVHRQVDAGELPMPLLISPASVALTRGFLSEAWPSVSAIGDDSGALYRAFGIGRASLKSLLGFKVWGAGLRALLKGNGIGMPVGDYRMMSGAFVVRGAEILAGRASEHAGDLPGLLEDLGARLRHAE